MRLRIKILSGFLILVLMLSIAGVWSIYTLMDMSNSAQDMLDDNFKSINASRIMLEALEREDRGVLLLLLGRWAEGRKIIISGDSLFSIGFNIAANNLTIHNEKAYVDSIELNYKKFKQLWEQSIVDTERAGNINWYFQSPHTSFMRVKSSINKLRFLNDQVMFQTASDMKNKANRATMPGVVAIISALVFALMFNFFVEHYFVKPVILISKNIKEFLENKRSFNIKLEAKDEISDLSESISKLCTLVKDRK